MSQFRFLLKLDAQAGHAIAATQAPVGRMGLRLQPLLPHTSRAAGLGLAPGGQDWFVAESTSEFDPAAAWDECHRQLAPGQGFAATGGVAFVEPDWPQTWITEERAENMTPFAVNASCDLEESWKSLPHGNEIDWHLDDAHSALRKARNSVSLDGNRPVRVGHLDTGYDPQHKLLPEKLNRNLQKNFVDGEDPADASDPYRTGLLKTPGHGTGTISILAGAKADGLQFPDENTGDYIGGAPMAEVVPVRISPSVVLFFTSAFAKGLDYLVGGLDLACDVVTMSMGGLASGAWTEIVNRAYERGVCIFAAAGNNIRGLPTRHIVYPARYKRVTAVCGVMADGLPYYDLNGEMEGNFGPDSKMATAIAAYTPNIPWAKWGCSKAFRRNGEGTSSATPQAAAAAALYIQKYLPQIQAYGQPWQKVEAVRKALFDGASRNTRPDWKKFFGNGILNSAAALAIAPAQAQQLVKQAQDSASFPFLRVITGWGIAPAPTDMLNLEVVQLTQQDPALQQILPDPDSTADTPENQAKVREFLDAVVQSTTASAALKNAIKNGLAGRQIPAAAPQREAAKPAVAAGKPIYPAPARRRLRGYAFDPSLSTQLSTISISETVYQVRWEHELKPGPCGEYVEVADTDYAGGVNAAPVDLNEPHALAQDGLTPSEGNMQFHQQMVYAVAMQTIERFETALGRKALWAAEDKDHYVPRLKLHPHAIQDANAYYSPDRKAILFGYFNAKKLAPGLVYPGGIVYSCLSQAIVAHEVTHALLDGMHRGLRQATNPDVLAFHEAFADLVALFLQFSNREVLRNQLAKIRGDMEVKSLLGELAIQFGNAITGHGALRDAIGKSSALGWQRLNPDVAAMDTVTEAHDRGAILVAAVFDAFVKIYQNRTADLVRIATGGTGVLPSGALHPDLVERLAGEAEKTAEHMLNVCIRALDYCPPVDLTFGDYLRALITADYDLVPEDNYHYRVAFIEAFRAWGIYPLDLTTLSEETLLWRPPQENITQEIESVFEVLRSFAARHTAFDSREEIFKCTWDCKLELKEALYKILQDRHAAAHLAMAFGLDKDLDINIENLRLAQRIAPDGNLNSQIIVSVMQSLDGTAGQSSFSGGANIIADLNHGVVRYCVTKTATSETRKLRNAKYMSTPAAGLLQHVKEPFALLHAGHEVARPVIALKAAA